MLGLLALACLAGLGHGAAAQADEESASGTGLPLPRFVSFKTEPVNVRVGPGRDYPIAWRYNKRGLPMEIIQEFEQWRRVRDSEGGEGWVYHSLLTSQRTALVVPWRKGEDFHLPLRRAAPAESGPVALMEPGVILRVDSCDGTICHGEVAGQSGYVDQNQLWGVYPGERFN